MNKDFYVYILASKRNGTLYVGITSNLPQRIYQHKHPSVKSFTSRHNVNLLVYYEQHFVNLPVLVPI
jgi:putative endonuclease